MANKFGARKNAKFKAVSTAPSFNKTPVGNSTPPLPYPVTQDLGSSAGVVPTVKFNGDPAYVLDQSTQSRCKGDAPGSAKGVKSGTVGGEVKPVKGSGTVRVGGKPIIRDGDPCTLNGGNCPGIYVTAPAPGCAIQKGVPTGDTNPPVAPETPQELRAAQEGKGLWGSVSGGVHIVLDVAGFIPGLGAIPDLLNAGLYTLEGDLVNAGLSAVAAVPGIGDAAKAGTMVGKAGKKVAKEAAERTAKEAAEKALKEKAAKEATERAAKNAAQKTESSGVAVSGQGGKDGFKVKGKKSTDKSKCGEWLAKQDMKEAGFDDVVAVQNNSGHGVDVIGRNKDTGEVKVWEVKTTDGEKVTGLSKAQRRLGGKKFTEDRLKRAADGEGNYGKVPEAVDNAKKVKNWINDADGKISYEKREVFVDDLDKGCAKHPGRPSKSKPWTAKQ